MDQNEWLLKRPDNGRASRLEEKVPIGLASNKSLLLASCNLAPMTLGDFNGPKTERPRLKPEVERTEYYGYYVRTESESLSRLTLFATSRQRKFSGLILPYQSWRLVQDANGVPLPVCGES